MGPDPRHIESFAIDCQAVALVEGDSGRTGLAPEEAPSAGRGVFQAPPEEFAANPATAPFLRDGHSAQAPGLILGKPLA